MVRDSQSYWIGWVVGMITAVAILFVIGDLDSRGILDPILTYLGLPK